MADCLSNGCDNPIGITSGQLLPSLYKNKCKCFINIYTYIVRNWNLLLRQTESFKRYRLPTNISASIVKVFSFLKSISVLSTWKSSGVMSAKILISSNGISYDSETLFW